MWTNPHAPITRSPMEEISGDFNYNYVLIECYTKEEQTLMLETAKVLQINVICMDFNSSCGNNCWNNYGNTYGNNYGNSYGYNCGNKVLSLLWGLADSIIDQKVKKYVLLVKKACNAGELIKEG